MKAPALELGDIFRLHSPAYLTTFGDSLCHELKQALRAIAICRFFRAAADALLQIAADPKHLGARIGFLAVLHTWGQNLHHHPHLHCVVPGGGITPDQRHRISCRRQFLFPVKVLSRLFRAKFVAYLKAAFRERELGFHGELKCLGEKRTFFEWLARVRDTEWVVYAKPPFGGPRQVLKHLARYTRRVAISNSV
jgi:hypothetical protein